jgi:hypothetical protein
MSAIPRVRRATVEDVPRLIPLWQMEDLPWQDFEKRFREFQVIEAEDGELLGAIGIQIAGHDGCLHSEVFAHPEQSDILREHLWPRVQSVVHNHGLLRLWTSSDAPFWHAAGFAPASPEQLAVRPAAFAGGAAPGRFLQLKEVSADVLVEKEFAMFREAERERAQQLIRHGRVVKMIAILIGVALFAFVLFGALRFFSSRGQMGFH